MGLTPGMNWTTGVMTRKLWRALTTPPFTHPLYRRTVKTGRISDYYLGWVGIVVMFFISVAVLPALFFPLLLFAPVLFIMLSGTLYGTIWAINISSVIIRERQRGTYELLSVSPGGPLATNWALCAGRLHRDRSFERVYATIKWILRLILGFAFLAVVSVVFSPETYRRLSVALFAFGITALVIIAYIDYVQSIILSSLVSMVISSVTRNISDARLWTFLAFLALQVITYLLAFIVLFPILEGVYDYLLLTGTYAELSLTVMRVIIFYAIRETVIVSLWRVLVARIEADSTEFALATSPIV